MAIWIGAGPANFTPGRAHGHQPEAVVIHIMDGTLVGTDSWFNTAASQVSAHYGVGKTGVLHQYVKETDTAHHAGIVDKPSWSRIKPNTNPNYYTIGIEHEGVDSVPWPWPAAQLQASLELVRGICDRWAIPLDADHVITHHMIRSGKTCPGSHFDHDDYIARLRALGPAPATAERVFDAAVTLLKRGNLRKGPSSATQLIGVLDEGQVFRPEAIIDNGEPVSGNPGWFRDRDNRFLWSGLTDRPRGT